MIQSVQNTSPSTQLVCPSCPKDTENKPTSLKELFQEAREIAGNFQKLLGEAGTTFENKVINLDQTLKQLSKEVDKGLGNVVGSMQDEFFYVLSGLSAIFEGAKPKEGSVGGPRTVHPNAFKAQIEALKEQVAQTKPETNEEAEALAILQESLSQFVPAYEAYLGASIEYPSENHEGTCYLNAQGDQITEDEFNQIKADFRLVLENTTTKFLTGAVERVRAAMETAFKEITNSASEVEAAANDLSV